MRRSFRGGSYFRAAAATIQPDGGADRRMYMTNERSFVRSILGGGLVLLGLLPAVAHSQEATTVSGRVTATAGAAPLVGATVSIPALRLGATTDAEGTYRFTVPASVTGEVTLTARPIGYLPPSVQVNLAG